MSVKDLKGIKFVIGSGCHKYTAILPTGKKVGFGHKAYEHYKDTVPVKQGGGLWRHKNHLDTERRNNYRKRHGRIMCDGEKRKCISKKYTPAWFSYYFLW